jgi:carbamoyltransferase
MNILGLSFDYHDAAAALVQDGRVVAAAHEERFSRRKNDPSLPATAARFCLGQAGIRADQLDYVVHYERPLLKFDRVLRTALRTLPRGSRLLKETLADWLRDGKFEVRDRIQRELGVPAERIVFSEHHLSHAAAAFFCSPFDEAAIVTLDGVGEFETATISHGRGTQIRKLASVRYPNSLGLFYSAMTAFTGFEVNEGEYKLMGLSGFGKPVLADEMMKLFNLKGDGAFGLRQYLFDFLWPEKVPFTEALIKWLGPARAPDSSMKFDGSSDEPVVKSSRHYADVAASAQKCTEEVMLHAARQAMAKTGSRNVCLGGGVALNSVGNGRIQRELGCRLYVQPAAGDAGSALGAALHQYHAVAGRPRNGALTSVYLGSASSEAEIAAAIQAAFLTPARVFDSDAEMIEAVARRLAEGAVIGWFQGRAEWGPRALGCRSILADPTRADMQGIVNEKIKFREAFRPFAPSVLAERATEFFTCDMPQSIAAPEYFMLAVCDVRPERRKDIPAVTHVDGTARLHLVSREVNPLYYDLISAFSRHRGIPIVLNTSFNLRGEPIVNAPEHAIKTFQWSGMDCLVMGRHLLEKEGVA